MTPVGDELSGVTPFFDNLLHRMGVHIPVVEVKSGTFSRSSEVFAKSLTTPCPLFIIK